MEHPPWNTRNLSGGSTMQNQNHRVTHLSIPRHTASTLLLAVLMGAVTAANASAADLKRGQYLVDAGGCHDCHTPMKMGDKGPEPDMSLAFSGHPAGMKLPPPPAAQGPWIWGGAATNTAFYGPWGISYSANITGDKVTGLGNWKAEDFIKAMRTGKHRGVARPIAPPMPWQAYGKLNDADLRAMFAYLQSTKAISNRVPDYEPPKAPAAAQAAPKK